jgi:acyl-CoA thioesterase
VSTFLEASSWTRTAAGVYGWEVDPTWAQGRGIFGGLQGAAVVRAMEREVDDPSRALRSLHVHYAAPLLDGKAQLYVKTERKGARSTFLSARIVQEGAVVTLASATLAGPRSTDLDLQAIRTLDMAPPEEVPVLPPNLPQLPVFAKEHLEYRFAYGAPPMSGASRAELGAYLRLRHPGPLDAATCVLLLDALPPAQAALCEQVRTFASVAIATTIQRELPPKGWPDDTPWRLVVRTDTAREGYAHEVNELCTPDGAVIARSDQVLALVD